MEDSKLNATAELRKIPKEAFRRSFQQWQERWSVCVCMCVCVVCVCVCGVCVCVWCVCVCGVCVCGVCVCACVRNGPTLNVIR
jgi:hypothetical protein